jgi:sugar lactone lactonase YvrE
MTNNAPHVFATDLHFPECPRWHDGALWLSDIWGHTVYRFDDDGARHVVHRFPDDEEPSGLGWLPDGDMLVVGQLGRVVYRLHDGDAMIHADLRPFASHQVNDMIVGCDGTAYVSQFGREMWDLESPFGPTELLRVTPQGVVDVAGDDLMIPNGVAITDDGVTVVVAESAGGRLSRYSVRDGLLADRVQVPLPTATALGFVAPDGICLDAVGGVWAADPIAKRVIRVVDGAVDREIRFDHAALACVLGGDDRRTLYVCVNEVWSKHEQRPEPTGSLVTVRVDVPGAGRP